MLWTVLSIYAVMTPITLLFYVKDKRASQRGKWRTREKRLHTLAFLGGWPGALVGMYLVRHKTRKPIFVVITWIIIAMHITLIAWLLAQ